jgi:hypothetical protein
MIPVLFILVAVVPVYFYLAKTFNGVNTDDFFTFYVKSYIGDGLISYEHGWYMVHLFLYSLIYAIIRLVLKEREIAFFKSISILHILGLGALIGGISYVVRLISPVDNWIDLFGIIGLEPAHLPQYALFFALGIISYRKGLFASISKKTGLISLGLGVGMAAVIYMSKLSFMSTIMPAIWSVWAIYESFMSVSLCIGLLVFFREYGQQSNILLRKLAQSAFGAYVIHNFFVVLFQISLDGVKTDGNIKFIIVSLLSILCSFGASFLFTEMMRMIKEKTKKRQRKLRNNDIHKNGLLQNDVHPIRLESEERAGPISREIASLFETAPSI